MKKIGAYKILPNKQLIIEYYSGEITIKDLMFFKYVIRKEPNYNFYWNTVLDFRDCVLLIKQDGLKEIIAFFKNNYEILESRNVAYLSSKPNEVALSILYSLLVKDSGLNFDTSVFSSTSGVVKMFGEKLITEKDLIEIIDELKTKPNNVYKL